jgi:hypothetical protein
MMIFLKKERIRQMIKHELKINDDNNLKMKRVCYHPSIQLLHFQFGFTVHWCFVTIYRLLAEGSTMRGDERDAMQLIS